MKRMLIIIFALVSIAAVSYAQMGDARAKGLAGALTAAGDDMNALFYNPAGLAFVRKTYFNLEANADLAFNKSLVDPFSNALRDVYRSNEEDGLHFYYAYAPGEDPRQPFVLGVDDQPYLAQLEALAEADGKTYADLNPSWKITYYQKLLSMNSFYNAMESFYGNPRAIIGGRNWAASAFAEYSLTPVYAAGSTNANAELEYQIDRRIGAIAGFGFALGPIAIGANAKYTQDASYRQSLDLSGSGLSGQNIEGILTHKIDTTLGEYESDPRLEVGLGAILTMGTANLAIYNDNVMPFLDKTNTAPFLESFLNTMNFGLSLMPSDNKFQAKRSPFAFMATADFKNFGNIYTRKLCAGIEVGLNASDLFEALFRFGYTQNLPGRLSEMARAFRPENGIVSAGATLKLLLLKVDAACSIPVGVISGMANWNPSDAERAMDFVKINLTAALDL